MKLKLAVVKGKLKDQWVIDGKVYERISKEYDKAIGLCFGQLFLPKLSDLPEEIMAKTKSEALSGLRSALEEFNHSIKNREERIVRCVECKFFDRCWKVSLLETVRSKEEQNAL